MRQRGVERIEHRGDRLSVAQGRGLHLHLAGLHVPGHRSKRADGLGPVLADLAAARAGVVQLGFEGDDRPLHLGGLGGAVGRLRVVTGQPGGRQAPVLLGQPHHFEQRARRRQALGLALHEAQVDPGRHRVEQGRHTDGKAAQQHQQRKALADRQMRELHDTPECPVG